MTVLSLPRPARLPVCVRRHVRARDVDVARMTRYRGGTYSHTVDKIVFTDGSSARTDLIRLNPNIEAYSLDFTGHAPTKPSRYRAATWSAVPNLRTRAHEAEVDWILRNSYPALGAAELSRRLRAAGYPLGSANVADHEAIAATQAAIWHFTNDLNLDNRPRNVPIAERRTSNGIFFAFDGEPELGGYSVELASRTAVTLILQKSVDGHTWRDVTASGLNVEAGRGTHRKALGVGSTVSRSRHGRRGAGYRYYRLVVLADSAVLVGAVRFWLDGSAPYRNTERVVHVYDYLLAGAKRARENTVAAEILSDDATFVDDLVGPFQLQAAHSASLTAVDAAIVDADGRAMTGPVEPGTEFYVRPQPGRAGMLVTAIVPATSNGFGGQVITGVAHDDANSRLTPLALAIPAPLVVDFAIYLEVRRTVAR
ncbi:thioester domain-containing protein [Mycobacterium sp.]|uniref:thioester domain-containing protein n=1 Tax=Mycobacterium sp. TaxID=1785 RepID=UPI00333F979C